MKDLKETINTYLINNGYADKERISETEYDNLPEDEKKKCCWVDGTSDQPYLYAKDINREAFKNISIVLRLGIAEDIQKMKKDARIMKGCLIFLAIVTAVSVVSSVIMGIKMASIASLFDGVTFSFN